jgi:flavin-dependent dehydrogenase
MQDTNAAAAVRRSSHSTECTTDCTIVGASFAGLACATALARAGLRVTVLEKKRDVGEKLHTTGIIVKDAVEQIALLDGLPTDLVRRVPGVRLYAPSLRSIDLAAPGYYFLATDTPEVMRWLAERARSAGVRICCGAVFRGAQRTGAGFDLAEHGRTRYLVGADGPHSTVARCAGLGVNRQFLFGVEQEYAGLRLPDPQFLHCFVDRKLAPGYIGWIVAGPKVVQVGLAQRFGRSQAPTTQALAAFVNKLAPIVDLRAVAPAAVRAGMIPCGGLVAPVAARRVLLVGDAAGMVSPVTAGGIHTALKHGLAAGHAIADFLAGRCDDPSTWFAASYPRFRAKRALRLLFDHLQSDLLFDLMLTTPLVRRAAGLVYFHHKGVFEPMPTPRAATSAARLNDEDVLGADRLP